jgi:hypothetical protein
MSSLANAAQLLPKECKSHLIVNKFFIVLKVVEFPNYNDPVKQMNARRHHAQPLFAIIYAFLLPKFHATPKP